MTGRRSHGRRSALNGVVHQGTLSTLLLLRVDEAPDLVALDPAAREVPQVLILVLGTGCAQV